MDQAEEGVVLAKGEDDKFTEFKNKVADQFKQEHGRFKKVEEQLNSQNELGIDSRTTLDARFEQLANRMAELERTYGTTGIPAVGAPVRWSVGRERLRSRCYRVKELKMDVANNGNALVLKHTETARPQLQLPSFCCGGSGSIFRHR